MTNQPEPLKSRDTPAEADYLGRFKAGGAVNVFNAFETAGGMSVVGSGVGGMWGGWGA